MPFSKQTIKPENLLIEELIKYASADYKKRYLSGGEIKSNS